MVFHFFIFTLTISKRTFSGKEVERAYRAERTEKLAAENKQCCFEKQRII